MTLCWGQNINITELTYMFQQVGAYISEERTKGLMVTSEKNVIYVALLYMCFLVTHACDGAWREIWVQWENWPEALVCGGSKGIYQSPINIVRDDAVYNPKLEPLERDYISTNATIVDNIFNIAVGGKKHKLKQLHWHSPSEHTINGQRFAVELHMVHYTADVNSTVVSILYRYGKPDPFFFQIKDKLAELSAEGCKAEKGDLLPVGVVDMRELKQGAHRYFRYVGSLTAPPCTENVIWNILGEIREMTEEQAAALKAPLEGSFRHNCRPTQPLNGRTVQLYDRSRKIQKTL